MSKELKTLLEHFKRNCSVRVINTIEENPYFHWKRLCFESLNSKELGEISKYIIKFFSTEGKYSHYLPKIHAFNGYVCLTMDAKEINEFLIK